METSSENIVVIAVDSSNHSVSAVEFYVNRIHKPGNKVYLLHIIEVPNDVAGAQRNYMTPASMEKAYKEGKETAIKLDEKLMEIFKKGKVNQDDIKLIDKRGLKPGELIVAASKEIKANMVVMGTRGMGKLKRTILGSVSDYVIHHSLCPVMVCRFD